MKDESPSRWSVGTLPKLVPGCRSFFACNIALWASDIALNSESGRRTSMATAAEAHPSFRSIGVAWSLLLLLLLLLAGSGDAAASVPMLIKEDVVAGELEPVLFRDGYSIIWGEKTNVNEFEDRATIELVLDQHSGSGFKSKDRFHHGFFSASIKLPANYTAGVVTAFYTSNSDIFPQTHDEFDFEFLGVVQGMPYVLQTNIYGNGSVDTGREERISLWFDPTADFHHYSLLWNDHHAVFFVDNIPIRQMRRKDVQHQGHYPSKPMGVYATIWDGSNWATSGGKYPVDYSKAPFVAAFTNLKLQGRKSQNFDSPNQNEAAARMIASFGEDLNSRQKIALGWVRRKFMSYSYCHDKGRYPNSLPECESLREIYDLYARSSLNKHRRRGKSRSRSSSSSIADRQLQPEA